MDYYDRYSEEEEAEEVGVAIASEDNDDDDDDEEEEDRAQYRVPQFYSPGEDLRREDAAAAAKASRYRKGGYRRKK